MLYIKNNIVKNKKNIVVIIDDRRIFNPSIEQVLADGWVEYEPPIVEPSAEERYKDRIISLIRERYSIDDEIAILRQRYSKVEEFNEYNQFVEACKAIAHNEIYGEVGS